MLPMNCNHVKVLEIAQKRFIGTLPKNSDITYFMRFLFVQRSLLLWNTINGCGVEEDSLQNESIHENNAVRPK